jgi:predicted amidohydrolase YtcJ
MVTRKTSSGQVLYAPEGVTPVEAIRAYSIDGAYAAWEEDIKGTIEAGKLADLVVLDRDPLSIDPDDLNKVITLMTVIDGEIVYEA